MTNAPDNRNIKFATDLVTFYEPKFWGMSGSMDALCELFNSGSCTLMLPLRGIYG